MEDVTVVVISSTALYVTNKVNSCTVMYSKGGAEWAVYPIKAVLDTKQDPYTKHMIDYGVEARFNNALIPALSVMLDCSEASDTLWSLQEAIIDEFKKAEHRVFVCKHTGLVWETEGVSLEDKYVESMKEAILGSIQKSKRGGDAH